MHFSVLCEIGQGSKGHLLLMREVFIAQIDTRADEKGPFLKPYSIEEGELGFDPQDHEF